MSQMHVPTLRPVGVSAPEDAVHPVRPLLRIPSEGPSR